MIAVYRLLWSPSGTVGKTLFKFHLCLHFFLHLKEKQQAVRGTSWTPSHPRRHIRLSLSLTFAGLPITAQAKAGAAAAGPGLVAVGQQADVRAAAWLPILVVLTGVAPHWGQGEELSGSLRDPEPRPSEILLKSETLPAAVVLRGGCSILGLGNHRRGLATFAPPRLNLQASLRWGFQ